MKQYKGSVFFVDILGIGELTKNNIPLTEKDFAAHGIVNRKKQNAHYFAAAIIVKFRDVLAKISIDFPTVNVAQLSDCAFLWSEKPIDLLNAAIDTMWECIKAGVFCRGGITYGDIVEPDKINQSLGKFILGEAVTRAVALERTGKGCRIFSDQQSIIEQPILGHLEVHPFVGIKNPINCQIADEFRWYLYPEGISPQTLTKESNSIQVTSFMYLVALLHYSPLFKWNTSTSAGKVHIASSIETISRCTGLFSSSLETELTFSSEYILEGLSENRKDQVVNNVYSTWCGIINSRL